MKYLAFYGSAFKTHSKNLTKKIIFVVICTLTTTQMGHQEKKKKKNQTTKWDWFLKMQCVSVVRRRNNYIIGTLGRRTAQSLLPWQPSSVCQVTAAWFSILEACESNVGMFCNDNIFHNYLWGFCFLMGSRIGFEQHMC